MPCALRLLAIAFIAFFTATGWAQTSTGQITGTVLDSSGAVVPQAQVRVIGSETGELVRELTTDDAGGFTAPLLRPSSYTLEVSHQGFKKLVRSGVELRVDEVLTLRLSLEPGAAVESITVRASAEQLEEKTHSVGQVVNERTMQQLPLNGRNYLLLGNTAPGAVPNTRSRDRTFSAYGNRGLQNAFLRRRAQSKLSSRARQPAARCRTSVAGGTLGIQGADE